MLRGGSIYRYSHSVEKKMGVTPERMDEDQVSPHLVEGLNGIHGGQICCQNEEEKV